MKIFYRVLITLIMGTALQTITGAARTQTTNSPRLGAVGAVSPSAGAAFTTRSSQVAALVISFGQSPAAAFAAIEPAVQTATNTQIMTEKHTQGAAPFLQQPNAAHTVILNLKHAHKYIGSMELAQALARAPAPKINAASAAAGIRADQAATFLRTLTAPSGSSVDSRAPSPLTVTVDILAMPPPPPAPAQSSSTGLCCSQCCNNVRFSCCNSGRSTSPITAYSADS